MESEPLTDVITDVFESHEDLAEAARGGDDSAKNRLTAKVMEETGMGADAASATVERALSGDGSYETGLDTDAFKQYMSKRAAREDRSEWTAEAYVGSARKFADWYRVHHTPEIPPTSQDVKEWLDHLALEEDLKGSTIQRHFHGIKAYFKWEGRSGELANIDIGDEYPDRGGGTPDHLDWDEVEALREATIEDDPDVVCLNEHCDREPWQPSKAWTERDSPPRCSTCDTTNTDWSRDPYDYAIVQVLSGFGIRVGELVDIDTEEVDLENRTLTIKRQKRTAEWEDHMYMLDEDARALRAMLDHREDINETGVEESDALFITGRSLRAHTDFIRDRLNEVAIRAGVRVYEDDGEEKTEVYPHLLRHSVGAKLTREGFTEFQVGQYLGHSRGSSTQTYMSLDPEQTREMREALEEH